jgi:FtsP/CotA-like multicopper oxidase with cupredoxin domain
VASSGSNSSDGGNSSDSTGSDLTPLHRLDQLYDQFNSEAFKSSDIQNSFEGYLVNGQVQPTVQLRKNDTVLMRMVHTGFDRALILDFGESCTARLVARDGVFQKTPYMDSRYMVFLQGARADIAVMCAQEGSFSVDAVDASAAGASDCLSGDVFVKSGIFTLEVSTGEGGDTNSSGTNSSVDGSNNNNNNNNSSMVALPTSQAMLPAYLMDLTNMTAFYLVKNGALGGRPFFFFSPALPRSPLSLTHPMQTPTAAASSTSRSGCSSASPTSTTAPISSTKPTRSALTASVLSRDGETTRRTSTPALAAVRAARARSGRRRSHRARARIRAYSRRGLSSAAGRRQCFERRRLWWASAGARAAVRSSHRG